MKFACQPSRGGVTVELLATPETRPGRHREPYLGGPPVSWPGAGALPTLPGATLLNHAASDEDMGAPDPLQHRDPWKHFALSTPQTRRSQDVHSGLTPMLSDKFQKIEEFLNAPSLHEISAPVPASHENQLLAAILAGVQSLQRNSVTRDQLKHLVELQREEFHTYVRAETEPLHNAISQMHSNVEKLAHDTHQVSERMGKLEGRVSQSSGVGEPSSRSQ